MGLIDTNLLVYAHNELSSYFIGAKTFLKNQANRSELCFTPQIFLEAYRIFTQKIEKPLTIKQAWQVIGYYQTFPSVRIVYPKASVLTIIERLSVRYKIKGSIIFDTYLVATMLCNDIKTIYTHNVKDLIMYKEIKVIDPLMQ